jgi:hypothetical protein
MLILPYCNTRVRCAKVYSDCTSFMFSLHVLSSKGKKLKKKLKTELGRYAALVFHSFRIITHWYIYIYIQIKRLFGCIVALLFLWQ